MILGGENLEEYEDEEDYLDDEEEKVADEQERGLRDPAIQNIYGMNRFMLDPEAKRKFRDLFTKDVVLANLDSKELRTAREWIEIYSIFDDLSLYYPELERNKNMVLNKISALFNTSRSKDGFAAKLAVTQMIEQKRSSKIEREKKTSSIPWFPSWGKKRRRY